MPYYIDFDWQSDLLDLKKKLISTSNQHFYSRTFLAQPWPKRCRMMIYQSTKKKSSSELEKLLINIFKKRLDINHSIWPWQHVHWQALREVDWKLFIQLFSILNDCLLGTHGPRYCNNLVCSIYLPIMFHLPTSLPLYLVCKRQSNIFNSFNFVWFHFNHRFFLCWKINKIAPQSVFLLVDC